MSVNAEHLFIQPLRDVVTAANVALGNVPEGNDDMYQAAQALAREGGRALRKVQLLWNELASKHGETFKDMMLQQGSIEKKRLDLEDLLWDFEDFTQPDGFEQGKFSALQAATKSLALDIVETAKRLNLNTMTPPTMPQSGFPPLPPLPSRPPTRSGHASRPQSAHTPRSRASSRSGAFRRGSEQGYTTPLRTTEVPEDAAQDSGTGEELGPGLRKSSQPAATDLSRRSIGVALGSPTDMEGVPHRTANGLLRRGSVALNASRRGSKHITSNDTLTPPASPGTNPHPHRSLVLHTSVYPIEDFDAIPNLSPADTRTSVMSNTGSMTSSSGLLSSRDSLPVIADETVDEPQPYSPVIAHPQTKNGSEHTLIGIEELLNEASLSNERRKSRPAYPRLPDCAIREDSTYHKLKGFCRGGVRFRKDGNWDSIKLNSEFGGMAAGGGDFLRASNGIVIPLDYEMTKMGGCSECAYAHDLEEVEADKGNLPEATHTSPSGARYRLRLLFKSHLRQPSSSATTTDSHYACLWCVQAGLTVREGDATVFRSPSDLLDHLARHPQPLPPLPGVEVLYGPHPPPPASTPPFDLHLPHPPIPVPLPENVSRLPAATAIKHHFRKGGSSSSRGKLDRPQRYEGDMLEFMEGARIVGVMFPEKWGGKWCLGRHDGKFGAFPAKSVELRTPQESEVPVGGENGMSVTTRWKFNPQAGGVGSRWLGFGKGEVVTNVQCLYADYWCWSGTNSKGKTGVFPQSHIDLQTLRGQETTTNKKQGKGRGLFGIRSNSKSEVTPSDRAGYRSSTGS